MKEVEKNSASFLSALGNSKLFQRVLEGIQGGQVEQSFEGTREVDPYPLKEVFRVRRPIFEYRAGRFGIIELGHCWQGQHDHGLAQGVVRP